LHGSTRTLHAELLPLSPPCPLGEAFDVAIFRNPKPENPKRFFSFVLNAEFNARTRASDAPNFDLGCSALAEC
jgi:hypothetical protein